MDPAYRSPAITHPARSGMYGYPTEYYPPPYPPHPHIPAAPKGDYPPEANIDPALNPHVVANQKMPAISDLLSPEHQSQVSSERGASVAPSSRPYQPPTGFSHAYSPIRPQPYPPVYTRPQHEQYAHHPYPIAKSQPTPQQPSPTTEDPTRLPPMSVPSREATSTSPTHPPSTAAARSEDRTPDYGYDQQRRQTYPGEASSEHIVVSPSSATFSSFSGGASAREMIPAQRHLAPQILPSLHTLSLAERQESGEGKSENSHFNFQPIN